MGIKYFCVISTIFLYAVVTIMCAGTKRVRRTQGIDNTLNILYSLYMEDKGLNAREIRVLELRSQGLTFTEIGKMYGVTRERIRQIEAKALRKLPVYHKKFWKNNYHLEILSVIAGFLPAKEIADRVSFGRGLTYRCLNELYEAGLVRCRVVEFTPDDPRARNGTTLRKEYAKSIN